MDNKIEFLFILLSVFVTLLEAYNPYCEIQYCNNGSHTLCKYPAPVLSRRCGILIRHGLTGYEINRILELHNQMRSNVYAGRERRGNPGPLPRSHVFKYLHWDEELALSAQRWAEQCEYKNDVCRHVDRFVVGQIVGMDSTIGNVEVLTVDLPIRRWYDEVKRFNKSYIFNFDRDYAESSRTSKFSQLIWGQTTRIGCGALRYYDGVLQRFYLVCNYGPRGNASGRPVYQVLGHMFNF